MFTWGNRMEIFKTRAESWIGCLPIIRSVKNSTTQTCTGSLSEGVKDIIEITVPSKKKIN